jgi:hypothetical protein
VITVIGDASAFALDRQPTGQVGVRGGSGLRAQSLRVAMRVPTVWLALMRQLLAPVGCRHFGLNPSADQENAQQRHKDAQKKQIADYKQVTQSINKFIWHHRASLPSPGFFT